jgi:hypothetical protein
MGRHPSSLESRRPQLADGVERPRVHVKRRKAPAVTPLVREAGEQVQVAALRDACAAVASRRGPPLFAGRGTA